MDPKGENKGGKAEDMNSFLNDRHDAVLGQSIHEMYRVPKVVKVSYV